MQERFACTTRVIGTGKTMTTASAKAFLVLRSLAKGGSEG